MTTKEMHPLPPDVWSDPPLAGLETLECSRPVTTIPPTDQPNQVS